MRVAVAVVADRADHRRVGTPGAGGADGLVGALAAAAALDRLGQHVSPGLGSRRR